MKHFGTVKSYDSVKGLGEIKPEAGGEPIRFERSAFNWDKKVEPTIGQRLSYEASDSKDQPRALNLQTA